MACIDNIVTLGICPDEEASTSGFTLLQAPGMSSKVFANIANENYKTGAELAMQKKALTLNQVRNDFIGSLQSNNVITKMAEPVYSSSKFNTGQNMGTYNGFRGIKIHKTHRKGGLRKTIIKNIQLYPLTAGTVSLKIEDQYQTTVYSVELTANQVNTVEVEYTMDGSSVIVMVQQNEVSFSSAPIICHKGCGGQVPNDCAWVEGWDGTKVVKDEGYGVNVNFYCHCDYEQIICNTRYFGEIIWLKWQINIFEEQLKTNRFNNWVIYNRDELPDVINGLRSDYTAKWNEMMGGLFGILRQYKDECLDCRGIKWVTNI